MQRVGSPVVRDRITLEKSGEEDADPPEEHKSGDRPDCNPEAARGVGRSDEDTPVKSQDGSLDDWHGTGMQNLHHKHDLAIGEQFFGSGKLWKTIVGEHIGPYLLLANATDCNPDDVIDCNTKREGLMFYEQV